MNLLFTKNAWEDYLHWQQTDKSNVKKINMLIKEIKGILFMVLESRNPLSLILRDFGAGAFPMSTGLFTK